VKGPLICWNSLAGSAHMARAATAAPLSDPAERGVFSSAATARMPRWN
jgi:hypothetical protein